MSIDTPKVSIVTLLGDRDEFIPLLNLCVKHQTYSKSHIEWIILDDGKIDRSHFFNDDFVNYIRIYKKLNLGRKRQIACDIACGEFIIFFDDDDIHFPHRIEKSVYRLQRVGSRFVVGNSKMLICNFFDENIYEVGPFHKNHCTAGTMCFRKEIFKGTSFRESDKAGEEAFFLKNWTIPVVQLKPDDTIMCLAHSKNTVSKEHLFIPKNIKNNLSDYKLGKELHDILQKIKKNLQK